VETNRLALESVYHGDKLHFSVRELVIINRQSEIKARKVEIRNLLESEKKFDFNEIEAELKALEAEEAEINRRAETAKGIERGTIGARVIASTKTDGAGTAGPIETVDIRSYNGLFKGGMSAPQECRDLGQFLLAIADHKPEVRAFQTADPALGGFAVPTQWAGWLLDQSLEQEIVRPRAKTIPITQGDTVKVPAWQAEDRSVDVYGGFVGQWLQELQEATIQVGNVRSISLTANKLAIYTAASREVLQDAIQFENMLRSSIRDSIGFYLDRSFLVGTGVDQPQGLLTCTSAVEVNRNQAGKIGYADLVKMYAALWKQGATRPVWIASHDVLPAILELTDAAGHYVFQPNAAEGVPATLFGYPLIATEKLGTALGQRGDILLANINAGYAIGLKQGVVIDVSNAPGWTRDRIDFRVILRCDGRELWDQPMTVSGGKKLSWLVVLDAPQV